MQGHAGDLYEEECDDFHVVQYCEAEGSQPKLMHSELEDEKGIGYDAEDLKSFRSVFSEIQQECEGDVSEKSADGDAIDMHREWFE